MNDDASQLPRRVVVLGTTGSGKSTLARSIAGVIGAKHVELDALYHEANWQPAETDVFRARVADAIDCDAWVADGGYASLIWDLLWTRADTIVWLEYPLPLVVTRLFRRTMRRWAKREELWNGNRESLRNHFMSRDSLFLWAFKSSAKYRRTYPAYFARPELAHVRIVRFRHPRETERWLSRLRAADGGA